MIQTAVFPVSYFIIFIFWQMQSNNRKHDLRRIRKFFTRNNGDILQQADTMHTQWAC